MVEIGSISAKFSDGTPLKADSSKQLAILQCMIKSGDVIPISLVSSSNPIQHTLNFKVPEGTDNDTNTTLNDSARDDTFERIYDLISTDTSKSIKITGNTINSQVIASGNYFHHPANHNWKKYYAWSVTASHTPTYDIAEANNSDFSDGSTMQSGMTLSELQQEISTSKRYLKIIENMHTAFSYSVNFLDNHGAGTFDSAGYSGNIGDYLQSLDVTPTEIISISNVISTAGNATVRLIATDAINGDSDAILSEDVSISVNDAISFDTDLFLIDSAQYLTLQIVSYSNDSFPISLGEITAVHG